MTKTRHVGWIAGAATAVLVAAGGITYAVAGGDDSGMKAPSADSADAGVAPAMAVPPHHARDAVAVGDADAGKPEMPGLLHQLLRVRAATQEREIRGDGKLGVGRCRRICGLEPFTSRK